MKNIKINESTHNYIMAIKKENNKTISKIIDDIILEKYDDLVIKKLEIIIYNQKKIIKILKENNE